MLVLVLAAAVTACEPDPYEGRANGPRIAVIGDSIVTTLRDDYADSLSARGWNASVTGTPGYTTRDHWSTEEAAMRTDPDVVVIALGTNDVREVDAGLQTYDGIRDSVRHSIDITRGARCLVWTGINEISGYYGPGLGNLAEFGWVVNTIIRQELAASGRAPGSTQYGDWARDSRLHPEYFVAPGDVHLTPDGELAFEATVDDAIARCPLQRPFGVLDRVVGGDGAVTVTGWAIDPFTDAPIDVRIFTDVDAHIAAAEESRPDVDDAFHRGAEHGFDATVTVAPGIHRVCVHAVPQAQPGRPNVMLGCRTVVVGAGSNPVDE